MRVSREKGPQHQIIPALVKAEELKNYIKAHPNERFWEALVNWSGLPYLAISPKPPRDISRELIDTYYIQDK